MRTQSKLGGPLSRGPISFVVQSQHSHLGTPQHFLLCRFGDWQCLAASASRVIATYAAYSRPTHSPRSLRQDPWRRPSTLAHRLLARRPTKVALAKADVI